MTISIFLLQGLNARAIISNVATHLVNEFSQQSRWASPPRAVTIKDIAKPISPYAGAVRGYIQSHSTVFGGMDREPKKTPPTRLVLEALTCGYPVHLDLNKSRTLIMLYTFLIAYRDQKLAQLARIRTVSAIANTEQAAREQLNGMPLVFVCRTPAHDVQHQVGGAA